MHGLWSAILVLALAVAAPTGGEATHASDMMGGCDCRTGSQPVCPTDCCTGDSPPTDDDTTICECGVVESAPIAATVPSPGGSEQSGRDAAVGCERCATNPARTLTTAWSPAGSPNAPPSAPTRADLGVWRI